MSILDDLEKGKPNPAAIVDMFEDEEEHAEVAGIFNTSLEMVSEQSERERALADLVYAVKKNSCDAFASRPDMSVQDMMKDIENKKALEKLKKIQFHLGE